MGTPARRFLSHPKRGAEETSGKPAAWPNLSPLWFFEAGATLGARQRNNLVDGPLIVGVRAVVTCLHYSVRSDQKIGWQPQDTTLGHFHHVEFRLVLPQIAFQRRHKRLG